jgi:hypothetical protein
MNVEPFRILLASQPDRERLVAEIYLSDEQVADLSEEVPGTILLEIFPKPTGGLWAIDLHSFQRVLRIAEQSLQDRNRQ